MAAYVPWFGGAELKETLVKASETSALIVLQRDSGEGQIRLGTVKTKKNNLLAQDVLEDTDGMLRPHLDGGRSTLLVSSREVSYATFLFILTCAQL